MTSISRIYFINMSMERSQSWEAEWCAPLVKFPAFCWTKRFITVLSATWIQQNSWQEQEYSYQPRWNYNTAMTLLPGNELNVGKWDSIEDPMLTKNSVMYGIMWEHLGIIYCFGCRACLWLDLGCRLVAPITGIRRMGQKIFTRVEHGQTFPRAAVSTS